MRTLVSTLSVVVLLAVGLAQGAHAWRGGPGGVMQIKEALEIAEIGDYLVIEGIVDRRLQKNGELFMIHDDSGSMPVAIPEYLRREKGTPVAGERIRVSGKFDQKKLQRGKKGLRAVSLHRMGKESGHSGEAAPAAATTPTRTPSVPPAAPRTGEARPEVFRATTTEDFKVRAQAARESLDSAKAEQMAANQVYAKALYAVGTPSAVDPAIAARNEAAEARVLEARDLIAELAAEGRADGVDKNVIDMWEEMNLGQ
jgi:uncharacterized protein YdeI (BOF family)